MNAASEHHLEWNDRLQDWLDGEPDASFEAHLAGCELCQARLAELQSLDLALAKDLPALSLDAKFDAALFAKIDEFDEKKRIAAREQVERELQENLSALRRGWRRSLAYIIPGIVAGIALAFALTSWLDGSGVAGAVAAEGVGNSQSIQMVLTALLGAGVGIALARWLSSITD